MKIFWKLIEGKYYYDSIFYTNDYGVLCDWNIDPDLKPSTALINWDPYDGISLGENVEREIGEFEERYQLIKGFTSFYYAQFYIKAYQIYYRLRKISFGPFRGKSRLELKGNPLGELYFTDYLTPTYS